MAEGEKMEMWDSEEEEGHQRHPHVYKNGGNSEELASAPPMKGMVHTTIIVDQEKEEVDVSNNLDHEVPPIPRQGPATVKTTMTSPHEKREQRIRVANLVLRSAGVIFSFISFVIMASDGQESDDYILVNDYTIYNYQSFDNYEAYRYCLSMGVIAFVYLLLQLGKGIYTFFKPNSLRHVTFNYVDFIGDQILAYLLMSSSSSAATLTQSLRRLGFRGRMVDLPAASLSMSFIAFPLVAASSVLSAFALAKRILW